MMQDLGDKLDAGTDQALREGRRPEEAVHEVLTEAALLAYKGKQNERRNQELVKEAARTMPLHERPALYPHFRRNPFWEEDMGAEPAAPPDFFFSKKRWADVYGITPDMEELARTLDLPRPSRIQNLTYNDIVNGQSTVIADQAGSGKTLSYLLPLLKRHVFVDGDEGGKPTLKLLILAPTSDLAEQITAVARVISSRSGRNFRVHCCTGGHRLYTQQKQLQAGTDVLVATPGRLKFLMFEDDWKALDLTKCKAVVLDEVDVLLQEDADLTMEDLMQKLPPKSQFVFVTATLAELARRQLQEFEALPSVSKSPEPRRGSPKKGMVWHTGPGLHKVSPMCEHVLVDCTPEGLTEMRSDRRHSTVMRDKVLALAWHLRSGVLRDVEDNRVVIFCNTIDNCRVIENELRKLDPRDKRTGNKAWRPLVLHSARSQEDYRAVVAEFHGDAVNARDFFKKKLLISTDRLSRGIDFSRKPVNWVVLFDWPRDATEFLRRVGRTARGGGRGSVLSLASGVKELKMSKMIVSAAIRSVPLQGGLQEDITENFRVLERFNPTHKDWRAPEASAARPRSEKEEGEVAPQAPGDDDEGEEEQPKAWDRPIRGKEDGEDDASADDAWAPWTDKSWNGSEGVPWEEGDAGFLEDDFDYGDDIDEDPLERDSLGVSLKD